MLSYLLCVFKGWLYEGTKVEGWETLAKEQFYLPQGKK